MVHLEGLNSKQKEAALHKEGPLLILAGAGAGKTKTITHRILHLIKEGVAPRNILAVTFTNKAAKEMRERVRNLIEKDPELNLPLSFHEQPFVSTFHSLGVSILKENATLFGLTRHFTIYDRADSKRAIREAMEGLGINPKQFEPAKILGVISKEKGDAVSGGDYFEKIGNDYFPRIVARVWERYEAILKKEKALDFDDLLLKTALLLKGNPEIRAHYQNVWPYIHIDEYQDTNRVQYTIAKILAERDKNICVVGDIDQNIYSWRGADLRNILNFEKDYPDAKVILLEENYRSTQVILSVANAIIEKNIHRKKKNLFTRKTGGEKIGLFQAYDETDEAYYIAARSKELMRSGVSAREIAVLYRANFQSRVLEEAFLSLEIPYQILGTKFFDRKEVKDVLSFIRLALNPDSLADIKRTINVPPRGIGKVTLLKIFEGKEDTLPGGTREKIKKFRTLLGTIAETALKDRPSETIKFVMRETGMERMFRDGTDEDKERLENLKELVTLAVRYDAMPLGDGIEKLLEDAALATDQDEMEKDEDKVKLMTVHASKGLEFDYVFISGLEENLFPHHRIGEEEKSGEDSEEERRLFYVAVTRARKKVFLSYASLRTIFGSKQVNIPSEFITDIDDIYIEVEEGRKGEKTIYFD